MKNTNITLITAIGLFLPMILGCRTHKQLTSSSTTSTTVCSASIDSVAQRLMSQHHRTTRITVLPMQTPALPPLPTPDAPAPVQDLITQLLEQGGGTIIIQEDEQLQQDQSNATSQISTQDTTTTQNTQYHETQSNPPRASPNLQLILYILLAAIVLILLVRFRIRQ